MAYSTMYITWRVAQVLLSSSRLYSTAVVGTIYTTMAHNLTTRHACVIVVPAIQRRNTSTCYRWRCSCTCCLWVAKAILNPAHQEVAVPTMTSPRWDADQVVDMLSDIDLEDSDDLGEPMCSGSDIDFPNPESDEEKYYF